MYMHMYVYYVLLFEWNKVYNNFHEICISL